MGWFHSSNINPTAHPRLQKKQNTAAALTAAVPIPALSPQSLIGQTERKSLPLIPQIRHQDGRNHNDDGAPNTTDDADCKLGTHSFAAR